MKRKLIRADELMKQLQADPTFREREERALARLDDLEKRDLKSLRPLLQELERVGIDCDHPDRLIDHAPFDQHAVEILVSYLSHYDDPRLKEFIVRCLGAQKAKRQLDGTAFIKEYETTSDEGLRFAILNTIALSYPKGIDDWLTTNQTTHIGNTLTNLGMKFPH